MASSMRAAVPRLERSCGPEPGDWIRAAPGAPGLERVEAFFAGHAFDRHRHDTYAIGYTARGVQSFSYRGAATRSLPGQVFVLHPDEPHDGRAGTGAGFRYRILYLEPRLIRDALGGGAGPLPFIHDAVTDDRRLAAAVAGALGDMTGPLEPMERDQVVADLADALAALSPPARRKRRARGDGAAVERARAYLDAHWDSAVTSIDLEGATGLPRYALARQFRACLGTSPHRYLTLRRLDRARALMRTGTPLADTALACGFADQSHMTRRFKQAYGLPPGRWLALTA